MIANDLAPVQLFARHTQSWSFDAIQKQYRLSCSDCGESVMRAGSAGAQDWLDSHECGKPEPVIYRNRDGSVRR